MADEQAPQETVEAPTLTTDEKLDRLERAVTGITQMIQRMALEMQGQTQYQAETSLVINAALNVLQDQVCELSEDLDGEGFGQLLEAEHRKLVDTVNEQLAAAREAVATPPEDELDDIEV